MAGLADAATDRCSIAQAPSLTSWSVCAWVKLATSASFSPIVRVEASGGTAMVFGFKNLTPSLYSASSPAGVVGPGTTLGQWTFVAATRNGTAGALYQGTNPASLTKTTATVNTSGTPDTWTAFGRSPSDGSEWFSGTIDYLRTWGATVLSDTEVAAEGAATAPVKAGTWGVWPFGNNGSGGVSLADTSGNARNLTAGSTPLSLVTDVPLGRSQAVGTVDTTVAPIAPSHNRTRTVGVVAATTSPTAPGHTRTRTAGVVSAAASPVTPSHVRTRTVGTTSATDSPTAPGRTRNRTLATAAQTSVSSAPGRTRARSLALAVVSDIAQAPGRVRARVAGLVLDALNASLPGRTRARTTSAVTVDTLAQPLVSGRALAVGTVVLTTASSVPLRTRTRVPATVPTQTLPWAPGHTRARVAGTALQATEAQELPREAGPWPPHPSTGQPVVRERVGTGQLQPAAAVRSGHDVPAAVVGPGAVVR